MKKYLKTILGLVLMWTSVVAWSVEQDVSATASPIEITTLKDFWEKLQNNPSGRFILKNDIEISGKYGTGWPIAFTGKLDGDSHTLKINFSDPNATPLFTECSGAMFSNLKIETSGKAVFDPAQSEQAVWMGRAESVTFENVEFKNNAILQNVSGIVAGAWTQGSIQNSTFQNNAMVSANVQVQDSAFLGMLAGKMNQTSLKNLVMKNDVKGALSAKHPAQNYLGGAMGYGEEISADSLLFENYGTIEGVSTSAPSNLGCVPTYVGGVAGYLCNSTLASYDSSRWMMINYKTIRSSGAVGSLIGVWMKNQSAFILQVYAQNSGIISGTTYVGGCIGYYYSVAPVLEKAVFSFYNKKPGQLVATSPAKITTPVCMGGVIGKLEANGNPAPIAINSTVYVEGGWTATGADVCVGGVIGSCNGAFMSDYSRVDYATEFILRATGSESTITGGFMGDMASEYDLELKDIGVIMDGQFTQKSPKTNILGGVVGRCVNLRLDASSVCWENTQKAALSGTVNPEMGGFAGRLKDFELISTSGFIHSEPLHIVHTVDGLIHGENRVYEIVPVYSVPVGEFAPLDSNFAYKFDFILPAQKANPPYKVQGNRLVMNGVQTKKCDVLLSLSCPTIVIPMPIHFRGAIYPVQAPVKKEVGGVREYQIKTPDHLLWLSSHIASGDARPTDRYLQVANIKLSLSTTNFPEIGSSSDTPFIGTYDGNKKTITFSEGDERSGSIFGWNNGTIRNLKMVLDAPYTAPLLMRQNMPSGVVSTCTLNANKPLVSSVNKGSYMNDNAGRIENCLYTYCDSASVDKFAYLDLGATITGSYIFPADTLLNPLASSQSTQSISLFSNVPNMLSSDPVFGTNAYFKFAPNSATKSYDLTTKNLSKLAGKIATTSVAVTAPNCLPMNVVYPMVSRTTAGVFSVKSEEDLQVYAAMVKGGQLKVPFELLADVKISAPSSIFPIGRVIEDDDDMSPGSEAYNSLLNVPFKGNGYTLRIVGDLPNVPALFSSLGPRGSLTHLNVVFDSPFACPLVDLNLGTISQCRVTITEEVVATESSMLARQNGYLGEGAYQTSGNFYTLRMNAKIQNCELMVSGHIKNAVALNMSGTISGVKATLNSTKATLGSLVGQSGLKFELSDNKFAYGAGDLSKCTLTINSGRVTEGGMVCFFARGSISSCDVVVNSGAILERAGISADAYLTYQDPDYYADCSGNSIQNCNVTIRRGGQLIGHSGIGYAYTIRNCSVRVEGELFASPDAPELGGIVASTAGRVIGCKFMVTPTGKVWANGVLGGVVAHGHATRIDGYDDQFRVYPLIRYASTITNCTVQVAGEMRANATLGGVVGQLQPTIIDHLLEASVNERYIDNPGMVSGYSDIAGSVSQCQVLVEPTGKMVLQNLVNGQGVMGGLVGSLFGGLQQVGIYTTTSLGGSKNYYRTWKIVGGTVSNSTVTLNGKLESENGFVGGLVGESKYGALSSLTLNMNSMVSVAHVDSFGIFAGQNRPVFIAVRDAMDVFKSYKCIGGTIVNCKANIGGIVQDPTLLQTPDQFVADNISIRDDFGTEYMQDVSKNKTSGISGILFNVKTQKIESSGIGYTLVMTPRTVVMNRATYVADTVLVALATSTGLSEVTVYYQNSLMGADSKPLSSDLRFVARAGEGTRLFFVPRPKLSAHPNLIQKVAIDPIHTQFYSNGQVLATGVQAGVKASIYTLTIVSNHLYFVENPEFAYPCAPLNTDTLFDFKGSPITIPLSAYARTADKKLCGDDVRFYIDQDELTEDYSDNETGLVVHRVKDLLMISFDKEQAPDATPIRLPIKFYKPGTSIAEQEIIIVFAYPAAPKEPFVVDAVNSEKLIAGTSVIGQYYKPFLLRANKLKDFVPTKMVVPFKVRPNGVDSAEVSINSGVITYDAKAIATCRATSRSYLANYLSNVQRPPVALKMDYILPRNPAPRNLPNRCVLPAKIFETRLALTAKGDYSGYLACTAWGAGPTPTAQLEYVADGAAKTTVVACKVLPGGIVDYSHGIPVRTYLIKLPAKIPNTARIDIILNNGFAYSPITVTNTLSPFYSK